MRFTRRAFELDRQRLGDLYQEHSQALLGYLVRQTRDRDAALDLLAETFAQAYLDRRKFRGQSAEEALGWLYGIARNQAANFYRRGHAERRAADRLGVEQPQWQESEFERIEDLASTKTLREAVARELRSLPDSQQEVIERRVMSEIPYDEIAAELGLDERAVRMRASRGLRTMAAALRTEYLASGAGE